MREAMKFNKLNIALRELKAKYKEENIFGIFLYGENDENIAAVVIPTFEEVCLNKTLINEYINDIKVIDVRYIYHATRDGFPEIMHSLYTDFYITNPRYDFLYRKLFRENREKFKAGVVSGIPAEELGIAIKTIMKAVFCDNSSWLRFVKQLTDIEKTAIEQIVMAVGEEGIFSQAKVASAAGISRAAMSTLIMKMQLSGVAIIEYMGNKGTYIKIIDNTLLDIRGKNYKE